MPTESLFGYILRVSETNGYDTPRHILNYAGYERGSMRSAIFLVDKLAEILGCNVSELEAIAYYIIDENGKRTFRIRNHNLGTKLPIEFLRITKPSFCPQCVQEHKFIDAFWDLYFAVACPQHRCQLLSTCPICKMYLRWFRPGLLTCNCGTNLIDSALEPASWRGRANGYYEGETKLCINTRLAQYLALSDARTGESVIALINLANGKTW